MTKYNLWFFSSLIIALIVSLPILTVFFSFFQAEDGIRDVERSRGLGDVYKRQALFGAPFTRPAPLIFI